MVLGGFGWFQVVSCFINNAVILYFASGTFGDDTPDLVTRL